MLIAQRIEHFLNGVSQRPAVQRLTSQVTSLVNGWVDLARGLLKRPAAVYVAKLTGTTTGWDSAFVHSVNRDDDTRYRVVIANGDIHVFNADGTAATVNDGTSDSKAYLTDAAGSGFRAVTVGDKTIIVNRGKTVKRGSGKTTAAKEEAFVTVTQPDFATEYTIFLGSSTFTITSSTQEQAASKGQVTTESLAEELYDLLGAATLLSAIYDFTLLGSTIHIRSRWGQPFYIKTRDGLNNTGLSLVKGEVQVVDELPPRAPHGTVLRVVGDKLTEKDDYWVKYDASGTDEGEQGVWRETLAPGSILTFDEKSMPHVLERDGGFVRRRRVRRVASSLRPVYASNDFTQAGWTHDESGNALTETSAKTVTVDGEGLQRACPAWADGGPVTVTLKYAISVTQGGGGFAASYVKVYRVTGGSPTLITSFPYWPGTSGVQEEGVVTNLTSTDTLRITIEAAGNYVTLNTPGYDGDPDPYVPVQFQGDAEVEIDFTGSSEYTDGQVVTVKVGTSTFTHTVPQGGQTAAQVATAVAGVINPDSTYDATSPSSGVVRISKTAGGSVTLEEAYVSSPGLVAYLIGLDVSADALIGYTVRNVSDGSTGTITDNTASAITVGSLTGGVDNEFAAGDYVDIYWPGRYTFRHLEWDERAAGDDETNPFPSFIDSTISDVFFYQNRLGFLSGENVVMSKSGDLFDLFRSSVIDLLDDDPIDVRSAHAEVSIFHSAVAWDGQLWLWSDNAQFLLSGEPVLSPKTVRLDLQSRYFNTATVRPVPIGRRLYFGHQQSGYCRLYEYVPPNDSEGARAEAREVTLEVPSYIPGRPADIAGDAGLGVLTVVASDDRDSLYVFSWAGSSEGLIHAGWSRWAYPANTTVLQIEMVDGKLAALVKRADGIYLLEHDLDQSVAPASSERGSYLDFRKEVSGSLSGSDTDFTLPAAIATDGSEGTVAVVRTDTWQAYTATRPNTTTARVVGVNLTGVTCWVGVVYEMRVRLSPIYYRDRNGAPETRGRFQLRYFDLHYHDTTDLDLEVTPEGRSKFTYSVTKATPRDGTLRAPVQTRAETAVFEIVQGTPGGARVSGADVEGYFKSRTRRG